MLKLAAPVIADHLAFFNQCVRHDVFPDFLRISKTLLLHRDDVKDNLDNDRLLSFLSSIKKIFENILLERLSRFALKTTITND